MSWPDVRPVLLMAVKAQERAKMRAAREQVWLEYLASFSPPEFRAGLFDPPSHDGTDPWKWAP